MAGRIDTNTFAMLISSETENGINAFMDRLRDDLGKLQARFQAPATFSISLNATAINLDAGSDGERLLDDTLERIKKMDRCYWSVLDGTAN